MAEAYVVVIGTHDGVRTADRRPLNMPLAFCEQRYEDLSDRAISDVIKDLVHEQHRRAGTLTALGGWDPDKTQIRRRTK